MQSTGWSGSQRGKVASLAVRSSAMQTEGCGILIMIFDVPMVLRAGKMSEGVLHMVWSSGESVCTRAHFTGH